MLLLSGCSGGGSSSAAAAPSATQTAPGVYTSDQLRQALLAELPTYQRAGEPDSGPYATLKAIRNFEQLQGQVTLDKPKCADASRAFGLTADTQNVPAAITTFARATGETITETLVAVPAKVAEDQISRRVPALCKTFRAKVAGQTSTHQVIESTPDRHQIGEGSRTVGLVTMSGTLKVTMWFVVFKARGYLGTVSVYGPKATRPEVEDLGRQALAQAERILP
jgi:hypothetical protein